MCKIFSEINIEQCRLQCKGVSSSGCYLLHTLKELCISAGCFADFSAMLSLMLILMVIASAVHVIPTRAKHV